MSGKVSISNKTVTEVESAFSEWQKQNEIKTYKHIPFIYDFINAGDDFTTSGVRIDDVIIDTVLQKEDSDNYIEEAVLAKPNLI